MGMNSPSLRFFLVTLMASPIISAPSVELAAPLSTLGKLPVREITVFKDGHVFVGHQGTMPVDTGGNVTMDYLPVPIIGTFWPYSADQNAKLAGGSANQRRVLVERTALTIRELLEANVGMDALVTEINTNHYRATIVGFPTRTSQELDQTSVGAGVERLPEKGNIILLKTTEGTKALPVERIQDVAFADGFKSSARNEEFRN